MSKITETNSTQPIQKITISDKTFELNLTFLKSLSKYFSENIDKPNFTQNFLDRIKTLQLSYNIPDICILCFLELISGKNASFNYDLYFYMYIISKSFEIKNYCDTIRSNLLNVMNTTLYIFQYLQVAEKAVSPQNKKDFYQFINEIGIIDLLKNNMKEFLQLNEIESLPLPLIDYILQSVGSTSIPSNELYTFISKKFDERQLLLRFLSIKKLSPEICHIFLTSIFGRYCNLLNTNDELANYIVNGRNQGQNMQFLQRLSQSGNSAATAELIVLSKSDEKKAEELQRRLEEQKSVSAAFCRIASELASKADGAGGESQAADAPGAAGQSKQGQGSNGQLCSQISNDQINNQNVMNSQLQPDQSASAQQHSQGASNGQSQPGQGSSAQQYSQSTANSQQKQDQGSNGQLCNQISNDQINNQNVMNSQLQPDQSASAQQHSQGASNGQSQPGQGSSAQQYSQSAANSQLPPSPNASNQGAFSPTSNFSQEGSNTSQQHSYPSTNVNPQIWPTTNYNFNQQLAYPGTSTIYYPQIPNYNFSPQQVHPNTNALQQPRPMLGYNSSQPQAAQGASTNQQFLSPAHPSPSYPSSSTASSSQRPQGTNSHDSSEPRHRKLTEEDLQRQGVWNVTYSVLEARSYIINNQHIYIGREIQAAIDNTVTIDPNYRFNLSVQFKSKRYWGDKEKKSVFDKVEVTHEGTFEAALRFKTHGVAEVCVLNFADATSPGGGVVRGRGAQEESLCRVSSLYLCLNSNQARGFYDYNISRKNTHDFPYFSNHMIYSPDVVVFRDDNFNFIPKQEVSVISAAAVNCKNLRDKRRVREVMKSRCRRILELAIERGNKVIILGAFGCGVFANKPDDVSNIFKELLVDEFYGVPFLSLVFAIKGRPDDENYLAFKSAFKKK